MHSGDLASDQNIHLVGVLAQAPRDSLYGVCDICVCPQELIGSMCYEKKERERTRTGLIERAGCRVL